jgi:hypothetical protein
MNPDSAGFAPARLSIAGFSGLGQGDMATACPIAFSRSPDGCCMRSFTS